MDLDTGVGVRVIYVTNIYSSNFSYGQRETRITGWIILSAVNIQKK